MPKLECKGCCSSYNSEDNRPLVLPCGRTLCRACVLKWGQGPERNCRGCYGFHKNMRPDDLKTNFNLLEVSPEPEPQQDLKTNFDPLEVSVSPPSDPKPEPLQQPTLLQLMLIKLDGSKHQLKVPASASVQTVKKIIKDQFGDEPDTTRLLYKGTILTGSGTLVSNGVKNETTIHLVTDYHGGNQRSWCCPAID